VALPRCLLGQLRGRISSSGDRLHHRGPLSIKYCPQAMRSQLLYFPTLFCKGLPISIYQNSMYRSTFTKLHIPVPHSPHKIVAQNHRLRPSFPHSISFISSDPLSSSMQFHSFQSVYPIRTISYTARPIRPHFLPCPVPSCSALLRLPADAKTTTYPSYHAYNMKWGHQATPLPTTSIVPLVIPTVIIITHFERFWSRRGKVFSNIEFALPRPYVSRVTAPLCPLLAARLTHAVDWARER
jgi:hypothetical protein